MGESYCGRCRRKTPTEHEHLVTTDSGRTGVRGSCSVCGTSTFRFVGSDEARRRRESAETDSSAVSAAAAGTASSLKGLPREAVYYGIAAIVAVLMQLYACSSVSTTVSGHWAFLVWFGIIGAWILATSRDRTAFRLSLALFAGVMVVGVSVFAVSQVGIMKRDNAVRTAQEERQTLIEGNANLPVGGDAILTAALTAGSPGTRLRIAFNGVRHDLGPLPTAKVFTDKEYLKLQKDLWAGSDENTIVDQPDLYRLGWGYEDKNHQRLYFTPRWNDEMLLGARLTIRNEAQQTVRFSLGSLTLQNSDDTFAEPDCKGWLRAGGRFSLGKELTIPAQQSVTGYAVFAAPRKAAGNGGLLVVEAPNVEPGYANGAVRWKKVAGGSGYGEYAEPESAASWDWPSSYSRWVRVAKVSGVGAVGSYDSDFISRSSPTFALTGGPVRLDWTLENGGGYGSGPYFFGSIEPPRSMGWDFTFRNPVLETDFYHSDHLDLDGVQAGKYRLVGAALNCRWRLELRQLRWE